MVQENPLNNVPFLSLITSLGFSVFRHLYGHGPYKGSSNRQVVFIGLNPIERASREALLKRHKPYLTPILADYMMAVTSGHWRTLEALSRELGEGKAFKNEETDAKKFLLLVDLFEDILSLYSSSSFFISRN